jgi:NTP pyrophosphatase (non-canonical NTP hydrolase)
MGDTQRNAPVALTLDGYQSRAIDTATYPGRGNYQLIYPVIALAGETGELAEAVLELAWQGPKEGVAFRALTMVAACGGVMERVKKVYRNDPPGELTPERKQELLNAIALTTCALDDLAVAIEFDERVEFPPVPVNATDRERLVKETGDILWYVADFCTEIRVSLGYVGEVNYIKLADRARRDAIRGSGDNR